MLALTGCTEEKVQPAVSANAPVTASANTVSAPAVTAVPTVTPSANAVSDNSVSDNDTQEKEREAVLDERELRAQADTFAGALDYIKKNGTKPLYINLKDTKYYPRKFKGAAADFDEYKAAENAVRADIYKRLRLLREDHEGSTVDIEYFISKDSMLIDKISTTEFGDNARKVTDYYFRDGKLVYAYEYTIDAYGTRDVTAQLPGKRCYFKDESMTDCYLNDADVGNKNVSYSAAKLDEQDDFIKTEYANLEETMLNSAYVIYDLVRSVPAVCKINGYVGDEYGGVLANVKMAIVSNANSYSEAFETNGDGYFEILVPVNTADDYIVSCTYGDFTPATVADIRIAPGSTSYSLGVIYMAEPGQNVHAPETYLLNANYTSPRPIANGEYCITFNYEDLNTDLRCFALNTSSGQMASDPITVIKPNQDVVYKYYVTDQRGGHSGNPMTYEMSQSRAVVRVYTNKGLVASYQVPVASAGTVWEVFEIRHGAIVFKNNYFYINEAEPFFR